jgi:hypothetical protein
MSSAYTYLTCNATQTGTKAYLAFDGVGTCVARVIRTPRVSEYWVAHPVHDSGGVVPSTAQAAIDCAGAVSGRTRRSAVENLADRVPARGTA